MNHVSHPRKQTMTTRRFSGAALLCAFSCATAHAAIFTVGSPSGPGQPCTHGTIQSAINAAESSAGADTVRLTRSLTYEPEANSINTSQELVVEGGYATCTQTTVDGTKTIVSGAGGATEPVFRITINTGGFVRLRNLTISGGDEDNSGKGGGIYFRGNGILDIRDSLITANVAGSGGGIYAEGTGSDTELVIGANVVISNNTARYNGGGIVADQIEMSMLETGSILLGNDALGMGGTGGYGGGLYIHAADRPSYAYVGSGAPVFGSVWGNRARYGGGVAIGGQSSNDLDNSAAELHLFTTDPTYRASINSNTASVGGGAVYAKSFVGTFDGAVDAWVRVWNADITDNAAPQGAAIYLDGGEALIDYPNSANFGFNVNNSSTVWPAGALPCSVGTDCGRIADNVASDGSQNTDGAILFGRIASSFNIGETRIGVEPGPSPGGVVIENNRGGRLADGSNMSVSLRNVFITGNAFSRELVRSSDAFALQVRDATIAGNTIGAPHLLSASNEGVNIQRSVLWQPGLVMLDRSGGSLAVDHVFASETDSLGGFDGGGGDGWGSSSADPRFVDPEHGDYSLRAGSLAIDAAAAIAGNDRDSQGRPRDRDLPLPSYDQGARDIGAFERQDLLPLVLNADFDFSDLRLWTWYAGEWDGSQNAAGGSGSGSWKFSASGLSTTRVVLGEQCIRLPGPGRYLLNGRGRASGSTVLNRDYAVLAWAYQREGFDPCTVWQADAYGELTVGWGPSWGQAENPAVIVVSPLDFFPTVLVTLIAVDGGIVGPPSNFVSAWFDGITLDLEGSDVIFANGFEVP